METISNNDLIATLLDAAEIEGPGTMGNLLRTAAERIEELSDKSNANTGP